MRRKVGMSTGGGDVAWEALSGLDVQREQGLLGLAPV